MIVSVAVERRFEAMLDEEQWFNLGRCPYYIRYCVAVVVSFL